eukprot:153448_1
MKENEGGEGIQKTEEVLLEEGKAESSIEPEVVLVPAGVLEEKETTELSEDPCRSTAEDDDEEEFCKEEPRPITLGPSHEIHFGPSTTPMEEKVFWMEAYYPRSMFTNSILDCCASGWKNTCFVYFCQPCAQASARTRMNGSDWWVGHNYFYLKRLPSVFPKHN